MKKQNTLIFLLSIYNLSFALEIGTIKISTDIAILDCISPCPGMHILCTNPATKNAITTTTARCVCDNSNPEKSYCIKDEKIIQLPNSLTEPATIKRRTSLINSEGKEIHSGDKN